MEKEIFTFRHVIKTALFWGSLWGILEATLGYILHWIPVPGLAGAVLFPAGLYFLIQAFRGCPQYNALFLTALTAASVKCVNLLFPLDTLFRVINPALAVLSQALAVIVFFALFPGRSLTYKTNRVWITAFFWKPIYVIPVFLFGLFLPIKSFFDLGTGYLFRFFIIENMIGAILIYGLIRLNVYSRGTGSALKRIPSYVSGLLFAAALVLEWTLNFILP